MSALFDLGFFMPKVDPLPVRKCKTTFLKTTFFLSSLFFKAKNDAKNQFLLLYSKGQSRYVYEISRFNLRKKKVSCVFVPRVLLMHTIPRPARSDIKYIPNRVLMFWLISYRNSSGNMFFCNLAFD